MVQWIKNSTTASQVAVVAQVQSLAWWCRSCSSGSIPGQKLPSATGAAIKKNNKKKSCLVLEPSRRGSIGLIGFKLYIDSTYIYCVFMTYI